MEYPTNYSTQDGAADGISVRIVRSDKFSHQESTDGEVIFEGIQTSDSDHDVVAGKNLLLRIFVRNAVGAYSSGVLHRLAFLFRTKLQLFTIQTRFENVPMAQNINPAFAALTLLILILSRMDGSRTYRQ